MAKKVIIKNPKSKSESLEGWVSNREGVKRLTIDVPASLHSQLKITSVKRGQTMGDLVKECLYKYLDD